MTEEVKKGKPSWRPGKKLRVKDKKPGFNYRWCDKDPANLQRRQEDGYVFASKLQGDTAKHDGEKSPTSVQEYREMVLMACPEEEFQTHREYFAQRTTEQTVGLKRLLEDDARKLTRGGPTGITGKIVIG